METETHRGCGGTILVGGSGDDRHEYCDRCGAYRYSHDTDGDFPAGTDRGRNQAAWDDGKERSPDDSTPTPACPHCAVPMHCGISARGMTDTRTRALALRLDGQSCIAIARTLGLSRQRVQQILTPPRAIANHVRRTVGGRCAGCGIIAGQLGQIHDTRAVGSACDEYDDLAVLELRCASCHRRAHQWR